MMMIRKVAAFCLVMLCSTLAITGCAVTEEIQTSLFDTRKINLTENTYAAADMLAQQTGAHMTPMTPMKMSILTDVVAPNDVTPFGQQVSNQIGSRFVQLGYNVQSLPQPPGMVTLSTASLPLTGDGSPQPRQMGMKPSAAGSEALVTGTYTRGKNDIMVSLRVIQSPDQRVIAAYDYSLPLTRELREMTLTAAERKKREENPVGEFLGINN